MAKTTDIFKQLNLELDVTVEQLRSKQEDQEDSASQSENNGKPPEVKLRSASSKKKDGAKKAAGRRAQEQAEQLPPVVNNGKPGSDRSWYKIVYCGGQDPRMGQRFQLPDSGPPCRSPLR